LNLNVNANLDVDVDGGVQVHVDVNVNGLVTPLVYCPSVRSMTGYGRGAAERGGMRAVVDVRAVNHRFVDLKLRGAIPAPVEDAIAARVRTAIERGAVTVSVHVEGPALGSRIDAAAARAAHARLSELAALLGVPGPDLALVVAQRGVVVADDSVPDAGEAIVAALEVALGQLAQMRQTEGGSLARELTARLDELDRLRERIAALASAVPDQVQQRLYERVQRLLGTTPVEWQRVAHEVALLAERSDVTEELVRLASHLEQARALVAASEPSGRRIDFLVQELGRELNTIGSKSGTAEITNAIVEAKAVLEKLREQAQNVE
jgi:uncharacterized protein (TIGR00255 family)